MTRFACISALAAALGLRPLVAPAQNQVANYAFGEPGTAAYEHFSFWIKDSRRTDMQYAFGKSRKDFQLRYAGPTRVNGQPGFKVQFTNNHTLYLLPSGTTLKVATSPSAAPKIFTWEYEGPVNGVGTFCSVCAPDEQAAMRLQRQYYLR